MALKKKKLEVEVEYDFSLIGIITELREYKLAWHLNNELSIHLAKAHDIEIEFIKGHNLLISNYIFETEHSSIRLLKNKSVSDFTENQQFLVPELNKFDYLMLIRGFESGMSKNEIRQKISEIPKIQFVQNFQASTLKSKENLIF